jgi:hypothetical protein
MLRHRPPAVYAPAAMLGGRRTHGTAHGGAKPERSRPTRHHVRRASIRHAQCISVQRHRTLEEIPAMPESLDTLDTLDPARALRDRVDALDRRIEQRLAEIRARQDEEIMLLKALSCQLRSRVERVERRAARTSG